jgi:hypothetical protein
VSPYILFAVGWALRDVDWKAGIGTMRVAQTIILALLLIVIVNNVYVFAAPRINSLNAAPYSRIAEQPRGDLANTSIFCRKAQTGMELGGKGQPESDLDRGLQFFPSASDRHGP